MPSQPDNFEVREKHSGENKIRQNNASKCLCVREREREIEDGCFNHMIKATILTFNAPATTQFPYWWCPEQSELVLLRLGDKTADFLKLHMIVPVFVY